MILIVGLGLMEGIVFIVFLRRKKCRMFNLCFFSVNLMSFVFIVENDKLTTNLDCLFMSYSYISYIKEKAFVI